MKLLDIFWAVTVFSVLCSVCYCMGLVFGLLH